MSTHRRRLSAILHADLTGFVRLMEGGEERTVRHLKSVHHEIWRPAIETGGGAVIDLAGDSILAEFSSALASVATAIDIQERMARFNDMLEEDQRLQFRIGLHLGEVIVDEQTQSIFGDGVNIAARIQAMAEPGGIAASRALRDVTEMQVEYDFVDGGEHQAKNVSRTLQIYHVRPRGGGTLTRTTTTMLPQRTLRFHGSDRNGHKYGFALGFDKLVNSRDGVVIGRDVDQCDVVLPHATVSRRHAKLILGGGALEVQDLGSLNGTSVDGTPVEAGKRRALQSGATLKIGEITLAVASD
jgi:class 3 adenylate cyclase